MLCYLRFLLTRFLLLFDFSDDDRLLRSLLFSSFPSESGEVSLEDDEEDELLLDAEKCLLEELSSQTFLRTSVSSSGYNSLNPSCPHRQVPDVVCSFSLRLTDSW